MTPQAFISSYAPRLRTYGNSLLTPVIPQTAQVNPNGRAKRGTVAKNYAEDEYDDDDIFEDSEPRRRATGLRSRAEDPNLGKESAVSKLGKEIHEPVDVQGIWRDWMGKLRAVRTDKQHHAQTALPLTLIPIRIDVDIQPYTPQPALPLPPEYHSLGINPALPAYRAPEQTPAYRLKDIFLWNLHETLITPDQFATILIHDLDLPNTGALTTEVSKQIRSQLEEYAGVALHPLFHPSDANPATNGVTERAMPTTTNASPSASSTPAPTPLTNGHTNGHSAYPNGTSTPERTPLPSNNDITAAASPLPPPIRGEPDPDDTYRCIISLNINLQNKLYTDKFEWSLLHPPGYAERFAKQTCADIGLYGEWVPAMAHAIYEAVLRLKKEACESGGLISKGYGADIDNMAMNDAGAGWRYDNETLGAEWEPKLEALSKEEIEKKEGDRERQLRRLRRETARFSSTANMAVGATSQPVPDEEQALGRGERAKKKRRFRSASPQGRGTPEVGAAGYGGGGVGVLNDWERQSWRCSHCYVLGSAVWGVRDGPRGPRSLCNNCGLAFERDKRLPPWAKNLHIGDQPLGR